MKKMIVIALALALSSGLHAAKAKAPAKADPAVEAKMKTSDCFSCHQVKMKVVGPSYKEVAKKYKGNAKAVDTLVQKVKLGGSGVWGAVPMTAHPALKDEEIKAMVQWVLAQ